MSNQKLQDADLLLVNRGALSYTSIYSDVKYNVLDSHIIQSSSQPTTSTHPDLEAGTIWLDTSEDPPKLYIYDGSGGWGQIEGGGGIVDPEPGDITITPPVGGSGTQASPYVLTPVTCFTAGGTVTSVETISISGQPSLTGFSPEVISGGARFNQPIASTDADGNWSGTFVYNDAPQTTAGTTYESVIKIGETGVYFAWDVTQVANATPIVGGDGSTTAPNASPASVDNDGEKLYGTGSATWADGSGTLRAAATTRTGNTNALKFSVDGGAMDANAKSINDGQTIAITFDDALVAAGNDGDVFSGALTNDAGYYQEWSMTKDTVANAFTIAPLVDQGTNAVVTSGNEAVTGLNAPSELTLVVGGQTLIDVEVSVNGGGWSSSFPVAFNPGDTLQARATTGNANGTEYTVGFDIGGTQSVWSVTTTAVAATIEQPQIAQPANDSDGVDTTVDLVSTAYNDNGTGAGPHTTSTWEVYEGPTGGGTPETSAIANGGVENANITVPCSDLVVFNQFIEDAGQYFGTPNDMFDGSNSTEFGINCLNTPAGYEVELDLDGILEFEDGRYFGKTFTTTWGASSTGTDRKILVTHLQPDGQNSTIHTDSASAGGTTTITLPSFPLVKIQFQQVGSTNFSMSSIAFDGTTLVGSCVAGTGIKLTLTDNSVYNEDGNAVDGVALDDMFKAGDKVVGAGTPTAGFTPADTLAFSTTLYTGNGATQTVQTGVDNTGKALVWMKGRDFAARSHMLYDTERGPWKYINTDVANAEQDKTNVYGVSVFKDNGYEMEFDAYLNNSGDQYVAWNFRVAPGFFEIVAFDGDSAAGKEISHNLGTTPGLMIVKNREQGHNWIVYHKETGATEYMVLDGSSKSIESSTYWNDTEPTDQVFTVGDGAAVNGSGHSMIAYLFADTPGLIKCGGYAGTGGNLAIDCGFKPGWVLIKSSSNGRRWVIGDNKRSDLLYPHLSDAEDSSTTGHVSFTDSGFNINNWANIDLTGDGYEYVYVAIAEDAMAPPPPPNRKAYSSTVFTGTGADRSISTGIDNTVKSLMWIKNSQSGIVHQLYDTERGPNLSLQSNAMTDEATRAQGLLEFTSSGCKVGSDSFVNVSSDAHVAWNFRAAPGFFDVVTYDGNSTGPGAVAISHDLGTKPGMIIYKDTSNTGDWFVYHKSLSPDHIWLNHPNKSNGTSDMAEPTDKTFIVDNLYSSLNYQGKSYVAYLFADTPGLIKCGEYTGDGTTGGSLTVSPGFKPGWVMVKCVDEASDWYIADTARGSEMSLYANQTDSQNNRGANPSKGIQLREDQFRLRAAELTQSGKKYIYIAIAEDAEADFMPPTGVLTEDADPSGPTITLTDVKGTWAPGLTAVNQDRDLPAPELTGDTTPGAEFTQVVDAVDDNSNLTSYPLTPSELEGEKNYFARVQYKDNGGIESEFSPWSKFTTSGSDITTWYPTLAPGDTSWRSVTYGNDKYVAIASRATSRVMHSPDGIDWTSAEASEDKPWYSITYGGNKFVAVGQGGAMHSSDGINWTTSTGTESNSWESVAYGNGKFVAVSYGGTNRVMYSTDGSSWTSASASENYSWTSVTFGGGKFVAVALDGTNTQTMYSTDGISWTSGSKPKENNNWRGVAYGNGKFVAVASNGTNRVIHSADGVNWTLATASDNNDWMAVTYGNGNFVAVATNGDNRVMYSSDGVNWTSVTTELSNWRGVTYGVGKFVAVADDGANRVMYAFA